jgi:hypothetical protein
MTLTCPFCGAPQTDQIDMEGRRILIFRCLFSPEVPPTMAEAELPELLRTKYAEGGSAYFRGMCDRLHLYVTKGPAARELGADPAPSS